MKKAIEIVNGMISKIHAEMDDVQGNYKRTSPNSIYDVGYRKVLEQMHDRLITKAIVLEDVVRELERAEGGEA